MPADPAQAFATWCAFLAPTEGGFSVTPDDPGNWTSGKPGIGQLRGTKFGIAASAHPELDIARLTIGEANQLRKLEYWDKVAGDLLPPPIAFITADAAYGSGPGVAARQLQTLLGVKADGVIGELTLDALARNIAQKSVYPQCTGLDDLITEYSASRLLFEAALGNWSSAKGGWTRRLFRSAAIARSLA